MQPSDYQLPPPRDWQKFERTMRDLFSAEWKCNVSLHGSTGQCQDGVDFYGKPEGSQHFHGVQCKLISTLRGRKLSTEAIREEVQKAQSFQPKLSEFTIVTTASRDSKVQEYLRCLSIQKDSSFAVDVVFWEDVCQLYDLHRDVYERHYRHLFPKPSDLLIQYLSIVARGCLRLEIAGLSDQAHGQRTGLEGPLDLLSLYVHMGTSRDAEATADLKTFGIAAEVAIDRPLSVMGAVSRFDRATLTGEPGSGKSTCVSYITLCLALAALPKERLPCPFDASQHMPDWDVPKRMIPIKLSATEIVEVAPLDESIQSGKRFLRALENTVTPKQAFSEILSELEAGRALVIVDGVDEVSVAGGGIGEGARKCVLDAVAAASQEHCNSRFLLTCRKASYVQPWLLPEFVEVRLSPFDSSQRHDFATRWYAALEKCGKVEQGDGARLAKDLSNVIEREDVVDLTSNPLLLTVISMMHSQKIEIPKSRAVLYEKCIDVLLWFWEKSKVETASLTFAKLLSEKSVQVLDFLAFLREMAYRLHSLQIKASGSGTLTSSNLIFELSCLTDDRDLNWARRVLRFIHERAGLLVQRGGMEGAEEYGFIQRSIQEYLAARHIANGKNCSITCFELVKEDCSWSEVVKLVAGIQYYINGNVGGPLLLVELLCGSKDEVDSNGLRLSCIGAEILLELSVANKSVIENLASVAERIVDQVQSRLSVVFKPVGVDIGNKERIEAGSLLSSLGDPRFDPDMFYLPKGDMLGLRKVLAGQFEMGTPNNEVDKIYGKYGRLQHVRYEWETPVHDVILPEFFIGMFPVTQAQYFAFVRASGYEVPLADSEVENAYSWCGGTPPSQMLNHPVVLINWFDAMRYCDWLTTALRDAGVAPEPIGSLLCDKGWSFRLPTEAEWEKAARGADSRIYPWGEETGELPANFLSSGIGTTSPVGCFVLGNSPHGVSDLAGNVWEWVHTAWGGQWLEPHFLYPYNNDDTREDEEGKNHAVRCLRGGGYSTSHKSGLRCTFRARAHACDRHRNRGFRVVLAGPSSCNWLKRSIVIETEADKKGDVLFCPSCGNKNFAKSFYVGAMIRCRCCRISMVVESVIPLRVQEVAHGKNYINDTEVI